MTNTPDTIRQALEQELDLMRQVADANADEALKARAERDALQAKVDALNIELDGYVGLLGRERQKLDAKDTEIADAEGVAFSWHQMYKKCAAEWEHSLSQIALKDASIARLLDKIQEIDGQRMDAVAKLAERDATIAKNDAFFKEWASGEDKFQAFGGWDRIERLVEDNKAMRECLEGYAGDDWAGGRARSCLQSLKEPNT